MNRIRPYLGHLAYGLLGTLAGTAACLFWLYLLRGRFSHGWYALAIAGAAAMLLVLAVELAATAGRDWWFRRRHPRRRAHARPRPHKTEGAA